MHNLDFYAESFKLKHEAFINGCDSIEAMGLWDKENLGEMDAFYSHDLASIIIRLIAVDKKVTQKEVDYLNSTFGFSYSIEELTELYDNCSEDIGQAFDENFANGITYMRKINSKLADAYKDMLAMICRIIILSDGIVDESEKEEIKKLEELCK